MVSARTSLCAGAMADNAINTAAANDGGEIKAGFFLHREAR